MINVGVCALVCRFPWISVGLSMAEVFGSIFLCGSFSFVSQGYMKSMLWFFGVLYPEVFPVSSLVLLLVCFSALSLWVLSPGDKCGCLCFSLSVSLDFCWVVNG